jgi:acetyl-CoA C-acetyltransferase
VRDAFICEPVRTAVGRFGGMFRDVPAHALGATVVAALLARSGLKAEAVEDVLFAQCYPSMDAPAVGRVVALDAGLSTETAGLQLDRRCGSGLQAIIYAILQVASGASDVVIAGGAESMSNAPFYSTQHRWGISGDAMRFEDSLARGRITAGGIRFPVPGGMIETAENLRRDFAISRAEQDEFAARSHAHATEAQREGRFAEEIVPVTVKTKRNEAVHATDEHPRAGATIEALAALRPIMAAQDPEATVTAGNASGQNDGASACIVASGDAVAQHGLQPFARLLAWSVAGVAPDRMGIGPVPAVAKALSRAGLGLADIGLIELNEAFAAQVLACTKAMEFSAADYARLNVNGSGISLGHPVGATGGRILATLLREMRRRGVRYGLETMCIGGGQGIAAIFEAA